MEYYTKYLAVILWRCGCGRCNRYGNFWAEKQESEAVNAESLTPGSWRNKHNPGLGNLMYSQPTWFIMKYGLKHKNRTRQCLVKSTAVNDIYISSLFTNLWTLPYTSSLVMKCLMAFAQTILCQDSQTTIETTISNYASIFCIIEKQHSMISIQYLVQLYLILQAFKLPTHPNSHFLKALKKYEGHYMI